MGRLTKSLIEKVREYEYLYDADHELYKNMEKKTETWKKIAKELKITTAAAKLKWKNIRDCYIRHRKSSTGALEVKKYLNWPWSSHMRFLDESLDSRASLGCPQSVQSQHSTSPTADSQPPVEAAENGDSNQNRFLPTSSRGNSPNLKRRLKLRRRSRETEVDKIIGYLKTRSNKRDFDGIDHLFLSYADTFRKFQPMAQALLKIELAELFARTEMKEIGAPLSPTVVYSECSMDSVMGPTKKEY